MTCSGVAAPLAGDEAALYRELQPKLIRRLQQRVAACDQTLEDACSFAWVQLIRCQPERGEALLGWLYVVACREAWRLLEIECRIPPLPVEPLAAAAAPDDDLELRDCALEALRALAALPARQRRLLAAKVAGCSYRELAALEGSSTTAVDRHLARARAALREERGANSAR